MLVRDESDDSMAEVRQAKRFAKREMLARQTSSGKARTMLRRLVAERLSHPLLEQIKSSGFDDNPLEEEDEPDYRPPSLAKWMAEVSQTDAAEEAPAAAVQAMGSIGEGEQGISELVALKRHLENDVAYSGGLTVGEFVRALSLVWTLRSPQELRRLFMQIDADSDGRVTWEELLTFLLQRDKGGDDDSNRYLPSTDALPIPGTAAHTAPVSHIVPLPDKDKYVTLGRDATLRLWSRGRLEHTKTLALAEKGWAHAAVYCPAQRRLAIATAHSRLLMMDMTTLRPQRAWRLPTVATALCLIEQPDVSKDWTCCLAVADQNGKLEVRDLEELFPHECLLMTLDCVPHQVHDLEELFPHECLLMTIDCVPHQVHDLEELVASHLQPRLVCGIHEEWVRRLAFIKEAGGLVSCADDGTLRVHTLGVHGDLRPRYMLTAPTKKPIHAFCYSQKHAAVATCGLERHVHWWSLSIAEPISTFYGHAAAVVDVAIDDEHHQLISVDTDACVRIWCVRRFVSVQVIDSPHGAPVTALLYDATLRTLLIAHTAPSAFISIDAKPAGNAAPRPPSPRPPSPGGGGGGSDRQRGLLSVVSSANLAIALAVDDISTVRSFHCADGDVCHRFQLMDTTAAASGVGGDTASCVAFDHSGRRLLVGQRNGRVKILNFSSGAVLGECEPPRADATGASELTAIQGLLVANLAYIVAVGWSREVWVWADQRDNQSFVVSCSRVLRGHRADVTCLDFAAPNMLATGSHDAYVMLWNFGSAQLRSKLHHQPLTPQPRVNPASASAHKFVTTTTCVAVERLALIKLDGETATPLLVTAGSDGRLRLWSASAAQLLHVLPLTPAPGLYSSAAAGQLITTLHWNARAGVLVAGDSEGHVGVWDGTALRPALSGQLIPMSTVARVTGDVTAEAMSDGDANALSAKERIYRCLRPLARWLAHGEAVLSTSILAAAWEGLVPRLAPEAGGTGGAGGAGGADGAGGGGAAPAPKPMLEQALAQHGASSSGPAAPAGSAVLDSAVLGNAAPARRSARRGERPEGERAELRGPVLDFTPLLMTGAGDECRLWTLDGQHVGRFGAERWRVTEQDTYGPPPPATLLEPASSWAHPPSEETGSSERSPGRVRPGAVSSAFLTALANDEPFAPLPAPPSTMSAEEQARIRPMIDVVAKHFRRAGMRTAARAHAPTHGGPGEGERYGVVVGERYDNPASERDALLTHGAQQGVFALLTTSQSAAGAGPLAFGRRPTSAALRQAASAPVLPPLGERRAAGAGGLPGGALDDATILRRAEERSRALLRARYREYQEETGRGPGLTTFATDQFFRQREEAKVNKPPPREPMKVHPLGKITRRERAEKGERMERMRFM